METVLDGNLSGGNVGNHLRDEERIELRTVGLMLGIVFHLFLKSLDATDTHAEDNTDAVLVHSLQVHLAILDSLLGSNHGQLGVAVHLAGLLAVQVVVHIEVLHLACELGLKQCCIEKCNGGGTTDSVEQVLPHLLGSVADRRNCAKSRYNYSF